MNQAKLLRIVAGFAVGPIVPALLLSVVWLFVEKDYGSANWMTIAFRIGYPTALLLGVPAFLLMEWRGWTSAYAYAIAGALLGLAPCFVLVMAMIDFAGGVEELNGDGVQTIGTFVALGLFCGIVAGLAFWLIVRPTGFKKGPRLETQYHP